MTHKVHPKIYRIKEITDWNSRGFYKKPAEDLEEDFRVREFLRKKLGKIGIEKIEIERFPSKLNIIISSARPGFIIGRGGEGIEALKRELIEKVLRGFSRFLLKKSKEKKKTGKLSPHKELSIRDDSDSGLASSSQREKKEIRIEIREIKNPWTSANLSANWVAQQIEKRVPYRRVLKQGISKISAYKEVKGVKIQVSGRLNGTEIARREWLKEGQLPLQTIRADIDYARAEAYCTYGVVGIKVWIYKGEKF